MQAFLFCNSQTFLCYNARYIFIPGGNGIPQLLGDSAFLSWLKNTAFDTIFAAVYGGSLLLGTAGYLHPKMMDI